MGDIDFHHPYQPYDIQDDFMRALYEAIDTSSIGIFESPTGTGKSLSLICGSLTWLRNNTLLDVPIIAEAPDEPQWIRDQERERLVKEATQKKRDLNKKLAKIRAKELKEKKLEISNRQIKRQKLAPDVDDMTEDYLVEDYKSDDGGSNSSNANYSPAVMELLKKMGHPMAVAEEKEDDDYPSQLKIFFASRTHSQLTQFTSELRRVSFNEPSQTVSNEGDGEAAVALDADLESGPVKSLALGSRKNLCIHPSVSKLSPDTLTETCLDLQDAKTPLDRRCKFLPKENTLKRQFRDFALAKIRDIEDLATLGKKLGVCPYYSSRLAIPPTEIVTLPYPLLLNPSAREALGIELRGNIVIIDEAHNLLDAISNISSATVSLSQLQRAKGVLDIYLEKYSKRLGGTNKVYIKQLLILVTGLTKFLEQQRGKSGQVEPAELLAQGQDTINIHKITKYLKVSKLARKVDGYAQLSALEHAHPAVPVKSGIEASASKSSKPRGAPVLNIVQSFLEILGNPSPEGRIFYETTIETETADSKNDMILKYMLLDPSFAFSDIVRDARSVILAGGTMEPMSDFQTHLFPNSADRVKFFSCGHVIPKENLSALVLQSGPSGSKFEFTHSKRLDRVMLDDLGRSIVNLINLIPDGVVVFFASYGYLDQVCSIWQQSGTYAAIDRKKRIFREPKDKAVDDTLREYSNTVFEGTGAILFAVVGGKMSEGINFSDRLGRAVFMIGLPFPNANTAEWKAKIAYAEQRTRLRLQKSSNPKDVREATQKGVEAGREYYENTCMRAVNQSIGRAIRHKGDYATIILVDTRYQNIRISQKLPGWIRSGLVTQNLAFGEIVRRTGKFFREKR